LKEKELDRQKKADVKFVIEAPKKKLRLPHYTVFHEAKLYHAKHYSNANMHKFFCATLGAVLPVSYE
jgi:hypothetical protein